MNLLVRLFAGKGATALRVALLILLFQISISCSSSALKGERVANTGTNVYQCSNGVRHCSKHQQPLMTVQGYRSEGC